MMMMLASQCLVSLQERKGNVNNKQSRRVNIKKEKESGQEHKHRRRRRRRRTYSFRFAMSLTICVTSSSWSMGVASLVAVFKRACFIYH